MNEYDAHSKPDTNFGQPSSISALKRSFTLHLPLIQARLICRDIVAFFLAHPEAFYLVVRHPKQLGLIQVEAVDRCEVPLVSLQPACLAIFAQASTRSWPCGLELSLGRHASFAELADIFMDPAERADWMTLLSTVRPL